MRTIKILLLDDETHFPVNSVNDYFPDARVELILESGWGDYVPYGAPSTEAIQHILRGTEEKQFDLIVLGNNLSWGMERVAYIHEGSRDRTIVVWNDPNQAAENFYRRHGFRHFGCRREIPKLLRETLASAVPE